MYDNGTWASETYHGARIFYYTQSRCIQGSVREVLQPFGAPSVWQATWGVAREFPQTSTCEAAMQQIEDHSYKAWLDEIADEAYEAALSRSRMMNH